MIHIRNATPDDAEAIRAIYNDAVVNTTAVFDYEPRSAEAQIAWLQMKAEQDLPVLVADENDTVLGYASYGQFRPWPAFQYTVENAIYIAPNRHGQGIGRLLLGLDTPPNQPHRADVKKMLVHRRARRRGLARALLLAIEAEARGLGRTLLTLDSRHGDNAEPLYQGMGYVLVGVVPGYSLASAGGLDAAAFYYKQLD